MEYIDITEKLEEFYHHLSADDVDRTIFSAKFGDGKTEFLHQFKEKYSDEYTFYTLYPVNYQIAPNEQIMEYIKRDLLFQLILNGAFTSIGNIPDSILLQWYVNENSFDIVKDIIKFAPSIIGSGNQLSAILKGAINLIAGIKKRCEKFNEFKAGITEGNFEKATKIIGNLSEGAGNIYELDPISWLIAQSIANKGGKSVLIIEDLDRIDPAHLFRILNIFSAHIDRHYLCSDKTIYNAYQLLYAHIEEKYIMSQLLFADILVTIGFKMEQKSVRDIVKVLDDFEDAYRKEEVRVTDDFCFLSDTPLVKLLAILIRLGIKRNHLSNHFKEMYEELFKKQIGIRTMPSKEKFIELLGCFAMNENSIRNNGKIYYYGTGYQMLFNKDQDGYKILKKVELLGNISHLEIDEFFEIEADRILEKALHYVN